MDNKKTRGKRTVLLGAGLFVLACLAIVIGPMLFEDRSDRVITHRATNAPMRTWAIIDKSDGKVNGQAVEAQLVRIIWVRKHGPDHIQRSLQASTVELKTKSGEHITVEIPKLSRNDFHYLFEKEWPRSVGLFED